MARKYDKRLPLRETGSAGQQNAVKRYEFNPMLTKITTTDGKRQYMLDGKPFGDAYLPKSGDSENRGKNQLGAGDFGTVYTRDNPESDFVTKRLTGVVNYENSKPQMLMLNDIATCVMTDPILKKHCVVGVFTNENKTMSLKVDGFTLSDYLSNPEDYPELKWQSVIQKFQELQSAVKTLHSKGYAHADLK
ncbi:MAG: hypothetical protein ACXWJK_00565 [Burkholderiaceae bacterium]